LPLFGQAFSALRLCAKQMSSLPPELIEVQYSVRPSGLTCGSSSSPGVLTGTLKGLSGFWWPLAERSEARERAGAAGRKKRARPKAAGRTNSAFCMGVELRWVGPVRRVVHDPL